jgi:hypothetical protein
VFGINKKMLKNWGILEKGKRNKNGTKDIGIQAFDRCGLSP